VIDIDPAERFEAHLAPRTTDILSEAIGSAAFVVHHRLGIYLTMGTGLRSPRLAVSRYYFDATPPTAVDFVRELRFAEAEVAAKRAWCAERGIRYLLAIDEFDEDAPRRPASAPLAGSAGDSGAEPLGQPPATAPRRRAPRKSPTATVRSRDIQQTGGRP
jgi:hypothetical protein